ncbi:MADS-box domain-containing protein [Heracleum sosnowskyi]|uniref:MADS-box domain-containing protein n=1 Tax=Heracleum sosnowskyi TaxID=360622 RepID=A0AAD8MFU9_9APIA|nr:MADS-box domain-containing protein [Heracleum sosnowskyi]
MITLMRRIQLAFISNAAKRRATCNKRKKSLKKKMEELATLCGVDVCTILHCNDLDPQLEFWPSKSETERVVAEFQSLSRRQQTRNMVDVKKFTRKNIVKAKEKLQKLVSANREKELTKVMFDCLAGRLELQNPGLEDLDALGRVVDKKLDDVEKRIEALMLNHPGHVDASTSSAGAMAGGAARD